MYVTRHLSLYKKLPSQLDLSPPEGPHSGFLVIQGNDGKDATCGCFGLCRDTRCKSLPLPQDRVLNLQHFERRGEHEILVNADKTVFIPVLGKPSSSNLYYVVREDGESKGLICTSSNQKDVSSSQYTCPDDVHPQLLDAGSMYQKMKITKRYGRFVVDSLAPDGLPPRFLRRNGWVMYKSELQPRLHITDAKGLDASLRSKKPNLDFKISQKGSETVIVGEWYCPFIFIREFGGLDDAKKQMEESFLYKMFLEQQWEEIFTAEATEQGQGNSVSVGAMVAREEALIGGQDEVDELSKMEDGMLILKANIVKEGLVGVGLSLPIAQKMIEEQRRGADNVVDVRVDRVLQCEKKGWKRFGFYVLVERYVLTRMNGSVVLTYSFRHTNHVQAKWE